MGRRKSAVDITDTSKCEICNIYSDDEMLAVNDFSELISVCNRCSKKFANIDRSNITKKDFIILTQRQLKLQKLLT